MTRTFEFTFTNNTGQTFYYQQYFAQAQQQQQYWQAQWNFQPLGAQPRTQSRVDALPETIDECHAELDIIRGVVPTPKGYCIDKARAKALMSRIKELSK